MRRFSVLVMAVLIWAVACSSEETSRQDREAQQEPTARIGKETTASPETTAQEAEPATAVGEEADLGDVSIRVFGTRSEQTAYFYPSPDATPSSREASGEYVMVDYVAENGSGGAVEVEPEATLEDEDGDSHKLDDSIEPPTDDADGTEIGPGERLSSTLFFDVPSGADPEALTLSLSGEEARIDLTDEGRGEIPPSDYLQVYHLYFNERAYEEIYEMIEPSSTQGITLGEWLDYFEPLWGEWYLGLDSLDRISEGEDSVAYDMTRTFYEPGEVETPNTVTQEMVRDGDEWKLVLREDQASDILAAQVSERTVAEETISVPEPTTDVTVGCGDFVTINGEPSQWQAQQFFDFQATPEQRAILDPDGNGFACDNGNISPPGPADGVCEGAGESDPDCAAALLESLCSKYEFREDALEQEGLNCSNLPSRAGASPEEPPSGPVPSETTTDPADYPPPPVDPYGDWTCEEIGGGPYAVPPGSPQDADGDGVACER